jgi:RNA polymerase sigma factor (sigma-70 family)
VAEKKEHQFAQLFQQYYDKVFRLAMRICLDATQAQDLAQEIFMKAYQKLDTFREDSALSTWLYSIAVNHCSDHVRREQRSRSLLSLIGWQEKRKERSMDDEVLTKHTGERILKKMSLTNRTLLVLKVYLGLDYREIGELMKMTPASVGVQLTRARKEASAIAKREGYTYEM